MSLHRCSYHRPVCVVPGLGCAARARWAARSLALATGRCPRLLLLGRNGASDAHFIGLLVAVYSSQDDRERVIECLQLGACDYLVKPLRQNELRNLWTRVWRQVGTGALWREVLCFGFSGCSLILDAVAFAGDARLGDLRFPAGSSHIVAGKRGNEVVSAPARASQRMACQTVPHLTTVEERRADVSSGVDAESYVRAVSFNLESRL